MVLTVKGKAAVIVQDAAAYQRLLDVAANADAGEGVPYGQKTRRACCPTDEPHFKRRFMINQARWTLSWARLHASLYMCEIATQSCHRCCCISARSSSDGIHPDDVPAASEPECELRRVADCHKNVTLIPANADKL